MRLEIMPEAFTIWLTERDTQDWASGWWGWNWPCSEIAGRRIRATFDKHGLIEIGPHRTPIDNGNEFNALIADALGRCDRKGRRLPRTHPAWFVARGQFLQGKDDE